MRITSRAGETALRAVSTDRVAPASSTDLPPPLDAATHLRRLFGLGDQLPRYKVTAVQIVCPRADALSGDTKPSLRPADASLRRGGGIADDDAAHVRAR